MKLFSDTTRTNVQPALHGESSFDFLDKSAQPAAERVRIILQEWFDRYPAADQAELKSRFEADFHAALLELALHEMLTGWGCTVAIHPSVPGDTEKRPDFMVTFPSGNEAFVEASVITDVSAAEAAEDARMNTLFDELTEKLSIDDYFLHLHDVRNPSGVTPPSRKIQAFLQRKIDSVDYEQVVSTAREDGLSGCPEWTFTDKDFSISIGLIPKAEDARGKESHRPIGLYPGKSNWGGSVSAIREKLNQKATRYGKLETPYVIAFNNLSRWAGQDDLVKALFGSSDIPTSPNPPADTTHFEFGTWYGPSGAMNTRVSGVLSATFVVWNLSRTVPHLVHNPFASKPLTGSDWHLKQATAEGGALTWYRPSLLGHWLGLPEDWPGDLFPNDR